MLNNSGLSYLKDRILSEHSLLRDRGGRKFTRLLRKSSVRSSLLWLVVSARFVAAASLGAPM